jgi:arylsulfatase A-like enzyme
MNKKKIVGLGFGIFVFLILILLFILFIFGFIFQDKAKKDNLGGNILCEDCNVLFIVSDALRPDVLGVYGGEANTPNIDKLANRGFLFNNAYTGAPWTLPSSVLMFTANSPLFYLKDNLDIEQIKKEPWILNQEIYVLNEEVLPAELFLAEGYECKASMENTIPESINVLQGFSPSVNFTDDLETALKEKKKFFYMKWFLDPHSPYTPSLDYKSKIVVNESNLTYPIEFYFSERLNSSNIREIGQNFSLVEKNYLRSFYVGEVEGVDKQVGEILALLEKYDAYNNTVIVFTSDHGEYLGEHGLYDHGESYYQETIRVPLIIYLPGLVYKKEINFSVTNIDLVVTLSSLVGVNVSDSWQGKSYSWLFKEFEKSNEERDIYFAYASVGVDYGALSNGKNKGIISNFNFKLFNLERDEVEENNLVLKNSDLREDFSQKIDLFFLNNYKLGMKRFSITRNNLELKDKRILNELKALGYIT